MTTATVHPIYKTLITMIHQNRALAALFAIQATGYSRNERERLAHIAHAAHWQISKGGDLQNYQIEKLDRREVEEAFRLAEIKEDDRLKRYFDLLRRNGAEDSIVYYFDTEDQIAKNGVWDEIYKNAEDAMRPVKAIEGIVKMLKEAAIVSLILALTLAMMVAVIYAIHCIL